jgi:hypothetical protein
MIMVYKFNSVEEERRVEAVLFLLWLFIAPSHAVSKFMIGLFETLHTVLI